MSEQNRRAGDAMSVDTKVELIERDVESLGLRMTNLEKSVDAGFKSITDKLNENQKANWPLLISALTFILGALLILSQMMVAPLENEILRNTSTLNNHMDGHPHNVRSEISALRDQVESQRREFSMIVNFIKDDIDRIEDNQNKIRWAK